MKFKLTFISVLLLFFVQSSFAQDYYFQHHKVEQGLSNNTVLSSLQDSDGFLWFGTKDGLNRFDGYNFKTYLNDPENPNSLGNNYIQSLYEFQGVIWVGTDNGLYKFDKEHDRFTIFNQAITNRIIDITNDNHNNLWFISENTVYKYNVENKKIETINSIDPELNSITETPSGEIWIANNSKIYHYSKDSFSFEPVTLDSKNFLFIITTIYAFNDNKILIGTQNQGVFSYNIKNKTLQKLPISSNKNLYVRVFSQDKDKNLLIGTESGMFIYNFKTKKSIHLKKDNSDIYAISDNAIYSITIDKINGIWLGTYFGGVNHYQKEHSQFKKYYSTNKDKSLNSSVIREIHKGSKDLLWIGTEDGGVYKFSPNNDTFTQYKPNKKSETISYYNIHGLLPKKGNIWIGTFEHGIDVMNEDTGKIIKHYSTATNNSKLKSNFIFSFYNTSNDSLIALTTKGIYTYNPVLDDFSSFKNFNQELFYTCFLEDSEGGFWAGSYREGLFYYNPKTKRKKVYRNDTTKSNHISSNSINSIFMDTAHNIWVTTENGLNVLKKGAKEFKVLNTKNGLPSNVSYSILQDFKNNLWISTSKGLVNFDVNKDSIIQIYTTDHGLLSDQFNYSSAYKDNNGDLYFGNLNGMIRFNPKDFKKYDYKTPVFLTNIQVNNQDVRIQKINKKTIPYLDHIELTHQQSSLTFEFASLNYNNPKTTKYWYKFKGLNNDWIDLGANNKISFSKLNPGNYVFKVKSLNTNGIWDETKPLSIKIYPPYWASTTAYLFYFLVFASFLYFILMRNINAEKKKNLRNLAQLNIQKEKDIYQAKIEFFTNVAHEIKTPLTLIKIPLDKLLKNKTLGSKEIAQNLSVMQKNTERLLNLVNELLDFRKTETEGLKLSFVKSNISELVRKVHLRFSDLIQEKNVTFTLNLGSSDIHAFVDEEAIRKILSNLFNNAIKYSEIRVDVNLEISGDNFELVIKNDGDLIPSNLNNKIFEPFYRISNQENNVGTGIGLSLALALSELHKGTLTVQDSPDLMNVFKLIIPLHQEKEFTMQINEGLKTIAEPKPIKNQEVAKDVKPIVLVVEDNTELLNFVAMELNEYFTVIKAVNGVEGLKVLENTTIHLVVSDVAMPLLDGIALCQKIKTNTELSHIPVILLSAKDAINTKISGLESGADAYISKPFSMDYVIAQIFNLLSNRKHVMEYYASSPLSYLKYVAHNKTDEDFINKLDAFVFENISNHNLDVNAIADAMFMSKSTLYRKVKELSNLSPNELVNTARLKKAAELLLTGKYKIFEISEMVGFKSQSSFGRNFQKQFDMTPSEYLNKINKL